MTRRQMLTALFGAAVLALPVAGCGHQPVQEQQGAESESDLRAAGIEVTELDEEEKARFRAAVQPMYDRFAQQGELIARIRQA